jgi:beta-galactosidase
VRTGFDYKGEPSPYSWPNISSNFGILDTCGFYKDNAYYYKAWWGSTPTVHIEPHWNWAGMEGKPIKVWVFGNGDQVEMFVNGHSIGSKPMPKYRHLEWTIPYSPGTLEAKSLINGRIVARDVVSTTGPAYGLQVTTTNAHIRANSEDCAMLEVSIVDKFGSVIPDATNLIHFASTGAAQILGVGNGDPTSHEPDRATQRHAFHGLCLGIAQAGDKPGQATVTVSSPGLKSATIRLGVGKAYIALAVPQNIGERFQQLALP